MAIYKRRKIYWYKFMWEGEFIRESTRQKNNKVAREMEAAHRSSLAKGLVGIRDKKTVPTLAQFCDERIEPWARATFENASPKTWLWYRFGLKSLKESKQLSSLKLDEIGNEAAAEFASFKLSPSPKRHGLAISSVNSCLRALRRVLRLAVDWGVIPSAPKIRFLTGEHHRERVISSEEERKYLAAAPPLLHDTSIVLFDSGMRPEECHHLGWEDVNWNNGRNGSILIQRGKTKAARRVLPMTPRVRFTLECRWEAAGRPSDGWVWPAPTHSGHIEHDSVKGQHKKALKDSKLLRAFLIYSIRHTFLTRLGESGCDAWTLARIAGHSNIAMSQRYVHPSENAVLNAISRLSGHNFGQTEGMALPARVETQTATGS